MINALPRPEWWINFLTTEPLAFASLDRWSGKIVVKGVQNLDDARRLATMGVDGIILSNHGGREGVDRMIEILGEQITRTMRLLGVTSLAELTPAHVTQLERLAPRALSIPAATEPRPARKVPASR